MARKQAKGSSGKGGKPAAAQPRSSSSRFSGKDFLHVVLIGLICTVIFAGIGVAISMSMGIPGAQLAGNDSTRIASNGTPVPTIAPTATNTEIPCEAQAWWDTISVSTGQVINHVETLSVQMQPQQIKAGQDTFNAWNTGLQAAADLAPCVQATHQALTAAATETGALYNLYLTRSEQIDRARQLLRTMDAYLRVTDDLENLKITVSEDWFTKVRDFTRGDCPARRWYIEQFIVRDYQRFFTLLSSISIRSMSAGDLQKSLLDLRTLSSSFKIDMPNYPACLQSVSGHYTAAVDATISALNNALNGNLGAVDGFLTTVASGKTAFETELSQIDPTIYDPTTANL